MILVIDNYDSFVYNMARYAQQLAPHCEIQICRNDALNIDTIEQLAPQAIIVSPGPCGPHEANQTLQIIDHFSPSTPLLGVCLGHQSIGAAFGAKVIPSRNPMHGRASSIQHWGHPVFKNVTSPFIAGRYHSLIIEPNSIPDCLEVIAKTEDGTIMAIAHRDRPIIGYQFHPESILTEHGYQLMANFLNYAGIAVEEAALTKMTSQVFRESFS